MQHIPDEVKGISYVVPLTWEGKKVGTAKVSVEKEEPLTMAGRYVGNLTTDVSLELTITSPEFEARMAKHVMSEISLSVREKPDAGE